MATGIRKPGEFCWVNILTSKPDDAREFFAKVLGWTYYEMPGVGHGIKVGGHDIGGIFDLDGPNTPPGTRPVVGVMIKVESADAAVEKITALGGIANPAFDVFDIGRMAVCKDPNGAKFDVWEPKTMPGADGDTNTPGGPSWSESLTTDVARATAFYTALFGWTSEVMSMPGVDYTLFKHHGVDVAGMMTITPEMASAGVTPHWGTYFTVTDADAAARLATELGATLFIPPMDIPNIGRFCGIRSPQGVMFYAIKYTR